MGAAGHTELDLLLGCLRAQRRHVLGILEGLDDEALRLPVLPSGWNCLGMVRHLALDVEEFWFRAVIAGDPEAVAELREVGDGAWQVDEDVRPDDVFARYRLECDEADAIIAATALDAAPAWWPVEQLGPRRINTLRETVLHVVVETATHAGHLDAARELLDGRKWLVMTAE